MSSEERGRMRTRLQQAKEALDVARRFAAQVQEDIAADISGASAQLRAIRIEQNAASEYRRLLDQFARILD